MRELRCRRTESIRLSGESGRREKKRWLIANLCKRASNLPRFLSCNFTLELKLRSMKCLIIVCIANEIIESIHINRLRKKTSPLCFPLFYQHPPMLRFEDMNRSAGGYSSTKSATIPAAAFQTPIRFGTPDIPAPPHTSPPYPGINHQSNPPSPGPGRAYPSRSATLNYPTPSQPIDPIFPHVEDGLSLIASPGRSTSIEAGIYEIKNDVLGLTVDFNEVDRKSVLGYQYHGKANQQVSLDLESGSNSRLSIK